MHTRLAITASASSKRSTQLFVSKPLHSHIRSLWAGHSARLTLSISPTLWLTTQTPTWRIQHQACSLQREDTRMEHFRFMPAEKAWITGRWMFRYVSEIESSDKDLVLQIIRLHVYLMWTMRPRRRWSYQPCSSPLGSSWTVAQRTKQVKKMYKLRREWNNCLQWKGSNSGWMRKD